MKSRLFYSILGLVVLAFTSTQMLGQCGSIGIVGEINGWAAPDHTMTRDFDNPDLWTTFITLTADQDTDENGFIDLKFRQDEDWPVNWGSADFPTGTGTNGGDNILATAGTYMVTFNCSTGDYNFVSTCSTVGIVGEINGWAAPDHIMTRDAANPDMWTTIITLTADQDTDENGFIDLKFRQDEDWPVNWGSADFPTGTGTNGGDNILATAGTYMVTFNCSTGDYNFVSTCSTVGIVGEINGWAAPDHIMTRDAANPDMWTTIITLTADQDTDENGFIDLKFRQDEDWPVNWGSADFPTGTGTNGGDNILATAGTYMVTFNCSTGDYNFEATCGQIGMVGEFNNWAAPDRQLVRDASNPNMWTGIISLSTAHDGDADGDIEVKFRENEDWPNNWGNPAWPAGTGTLGGDNIVGQAGVYDVTFNCMTGAYTFTDNADVCGDIGMIGDFNNWGTGENGEVTDVMMTRDPNHPSQFSLTYNFTGSTNLLFRANADVTFNDVWGGTFPSGQAAQDLGVTQFEVPGGTFKITFNCVSRDFNFERLGSSIAAPKVFAINVDGNFDEADWTINQPVSKIVDGAEGDDPNTVNIGAAYNEDFLFVAVDVLDGDVGADDVVMIGVDGDKSGGDYDASDVFFSVDVATGAVSYIQGTSGAAASVVTTTEGYRVEASVAWADLGVTAEAGNQIGFDLGVRDADAGTYQSSTFWNGDLSDSTSTSAYGALLFGELACGGISLYSDMIGDVDVRPLTDDPNTYVATYEFESSMNVMFRKDHSATVAWGATDFPSGSATVGGDAIPVTAGRYRVSFGCLDGSYSFTEETDGAIAYAEYAETAPVIDGDLSEYNLSYGMDVGIVVGSGTLNPVSWGAKWDAGNLYIAVQVEDAVVEGTNNPWDNDAIEMYFDGNHDSDGAYDSDFDTQLILDAINESTLWSKADGVPITDEESIWTLTANGYNIELRLSWADFSFVPGRNRTMGFTIGNNDSDQGVGRDYQSAWTGTADNWNNTAVFGDLQLAGGPLSNSTTDVMFNELVALYPNPAGNDGFNIATTGDIFTGKVQVEIYDLVGKLVSTQVANVTDGIPVYVDAQNLSTGSYFVRLRSAEGEMAVKRVIIQE